MFTMCNISTVLTNPARNIPPAFSTRATEIIGTFNM